MRYNRLILNTFLYIHSNPEISSRQNDTSLKPMAFFTQEAPLGDSLRPKADR
jgi:hypothetical protein